MTPQEFWRVADTIRGLIDDLERLNDVIRNILQAEAKVNWTQAYLRDESTALQTLFTKREHIQKLIVEQSKLLTEEL